MRSYLFVKEATEHRSIDYINHQSTQLATGTNRRPREQVTNGVPLESSAICELHFYIPVFLYYTHPGVTFFEGVCVLGFQKTTFRCTLGRVYCIYWS